MTTRTMTLAARTAVRFTGSNMVALARGAAVELVAVEAAGRLFAVGTTLFVNHPLSCPGPAGISRSNVIEPTFAPMDRCKLFSRLISAAKSAEASVIAMSSGPFPVTLFTRRPVPHARSRARRRWRLSPMLRHHFRLVHLPAEAGLVERAVVFHLAPGLQPAGAAPPRPAALPPSATVDLRRSVARNTIRTR